MELHVHFEGFVSKAINKVHTLNMNLENLELSKTCTSTLKFIENPHINYTK